MRLTRRDIMAILGTGAVAATGLGGLSGPARAAGKITVLNWQGYGTDEAWALEIFKKETGIEVVSDYFNSEAEMLTKLRTNPGVYDVVLVNCARTRQAVSEGLLDPIDFAAFPNAKGLSPQLKDNPFIVVDGKTYGVAWVWGMNALAYREGGAVPESYAALADPAFAGKVGLYDDAVTAIAVAALMTGQDMNDPKDLEAIKTQLKALKPNVKTIWSSEDQWNKAFSAGEFDLSIYWSGASVRSKRNFSLPVVFDVPKEGAIGWFDTLAIPATSENKDDAAKFINYMIDPVFYVEWATKIGAPASANEAAMEKLPADDLSRTVHDPKFLASMTLMAPMEDDKRQAFNDLWQEVKAFYAS
ncbi:spermidine/putrescine ABC transporter substrate-binding protein [Aureimonas sp. SA4125]|uniref:ABC transporter substrate-binding protein n=1 Tax=Aureimonas sp. SA4125 TaxID=2826993 RepID=UPI001CC7EB42|nr:extracellular solute-binding protein [Aureimonas sp. SA4125]BDA84389.1 spermidine/putrescine ABC transporter substrate-binding protein [Aureimonas sp. SA4125]